MWFLKQHENDTRLAELLGRATRLSWCGMSLVEEATDEYKTNTVS